MKRALEDLQCPLQMDAWECFYRDEQSQTPGETDLRNDNDGLCGTCKANLVLTDDGFPTCTNRKCGIVYRDVLDNAPEWKTFFGGNGDDRGGNENMRCGNPVNPLLLESSLGCKIMWGNSSGGGNGGGGGGGGGSAGGKRSLCGGGSWEMKRLRRYTEWQSIPHREKSLFNEFQYISTMAQNAGISRIFIDDAMRFHKEISAQKMFRGLNRDGIKAASIYISCRVNGYPRTAQEIADIFHLDKTSASNGCSMAVNLLHNVKRNSGGGLHDNNKCGLSFVDNIDFVGSGGGGGETNNNHTGAKSNSGLLCISSPITFLDRFCSRLEMPRKLVYLCKFIAQKIEKDHLLPDDSTPQSIASGIIFYIARLQKLTHIGKPQIRAVCNVSDVTINKCAKKIESIKQFVVPREI